MLEAVALFRQSRVSKTFIHAIEIAPTLLAVRAEVFHSRCVRFRTSRAYADAFPTTVKRRKKLDLTAKKRASSICDHTGVLWIELTLTANPIGSRRQVDGRVLLVHHSGGWRIYLHVAYIETARNISRQAAVAEERDPSKCCVMVAGQLAFGQDHRAVCGWRYPPGACVVDTLDKQIPLCVQLFHEAQLPTGLEASTANSIFDFVQLDSTTVSGKKALNGATF